MAETRVERPEYVLDEHLEFLDKRSRGVTNMRVGARRRLKNEFMDKFDTLAEDEVIAILSYWIATFGDPAR